MKHVQTLLLLLVAASAEAQTQAGITANDIKTRIAYLASDALRGRDTPSPGLEMAAAYIASEFKRFGLQPAGDSGTFIQRWTYEQKALNPAGTRAELKSGAWSRSLKYLDDFFLIAGGAPAVAGNLYFAGTASTQPAQLPPAARGQVVAFYVPGKEANDAWLNYVRGALPAALGAQASGLVLVLDPEFPKEQLAYVATNAGNEQLPLPMAGISYTAMKELLTRAGADIEALKGAPAAVPGASITLVGALESAMHRPPNVAAILPGTDPALKDTYVVFSAHMDHVGVGAPDAKGDSIYNGADDDASGTSAVLEIAEAFAGLPQKPKRSLIFLLVSGEEKGLFGSRWFVQNPPVAANKIVANINADMIGRNSPDSVVAIGQEYTSLGALVQQVARSNADLKLTVAPDLWPQEQLFFRSDHFEFARANIPAIFFTSGLHADYHKPSDEPGTIDNDKNARIARLIYLLGQAVAMNTEAPKWTPEGIAAMKAITGN